MIIIELMGGLGNQLQQYALYRKFISLGTEAKLDTAWFEASVQENMKAKRKLEIDRFEGVTYEVCTPEEKIAVTGGNSFFAKIKRRLDPSSNRFYDESVMYDETLLGRKDLYLRGYWACEYYYADIIDELRRQLVLPENPALSPVVTRIRAGKSTPQDASLSSAGELDGPQPEQTDIQSTDKDSSLDQFDVLANTKIDSRSCSIHLRRGDYLDEENQQIFGNICTDAYYDAALELAIQNGAGRFFIFSEDEEYAQSFAEKIKTKFGKEAEYVNVNKGGDSCYDIYLMSLCDINICANSTFSFWGARLNAHPDKLMIRPTKQKNSQIFDENEMKKLWRGWTFVDPEGRIY